jgi:AcrR family transcriptional regulator
VTVATRLDTREALIRAGEQLFAEKGIDAASLREINRLAGQANAGALHYHFGDRMGLLRSIVDKHRTDTEARRHALLDHYESAGVDDLRALAEALVLPVAAKLHDRDGGRYYLRINAEIFLRADMATFADLVPTKGPGNSMRRWHALLDPLMPAEEKSVLHSRFAAMRFAFMELGRRAAARRRRDDSLFTSHLVDQVTALLAVSPSDQTRHQLTERGRVRTRDPGQR